MELHQAILKYLSIYDNSNLEEGIFYNVLRDMNAFNNRPAYQNIVRAFIKKGFLKEIWYGRKDWIIKSIQYLKENQGFQADKVDEVINEISLGFKSFVPIQLKDKISIDRTNVNIPETGSFNKYEKEKLLSVHPQRPDDFYMKKGDIVFVKNGIARISEVHNEYLKISYLKPNLKDRERVIFYDDNIEYIITPTHNIFLKSEDGRFFYVHSCQNDNAIVRFSGTYADHIRKVILAPYTIKIKKFFPCNENEFMQACADVESFLKFRSATDD